MFVMFGSAREASAAQVAVFDDPAYVSTSLGGFGDESDNIQANLAGLGHTVVTFTGISAAAFSAGLVGADVLLIPEQENRALGPDLNTAARNVIRNFVRGGGDLIINGTGTGRDTQLLNLVFNLSLTSADGDASTLNAPDAAGTPFAGGPATLPANSHPFAIVGGLPRTARRIYTDALSPSGTEVAVIRFGAGNIVYLGWDWFDSNRTGCTTLCQDGGWIDALGRAVTQATTPLPARVTVFDNGGFVDTSSAAPEAESDNVQASLTSLGHAVSTFSGITATDIGAALTGHDLLLIPELESGDLGADPMFDADSRAAIRDFVSGGGGLIVHGDLSGYSASLLNSIFGFSVMRVGASGVASLQQAEALNTTFAAGPPSVPAFSATHSLNCAAVPCGSQAIYQDGTGNTSVSLMRAGSGQIVFLGWEWFNARPLGSADGGWLALLDRAVRQATTPMKPLNVVARVAPSTPDPATGSEIAACMFIENCTAERLGSFGAALSWSPSLLAFMSFTPGDPPFDSPAVNTTNTSSGELSFTEADPTGAPSGDETFIGCVNFRVTGAAGTSSALTFRLTSLGAAATFVNLLPLAEVNSARVDTLQQCLIGDVNGDGAFDSIDALIVLTHSVGGTLPPALQERVAAACGDANGEGQTNPTDANILLSFEAGFPIPSTFPFMGSNVTVEACPICAAGICSAPLAAGATAGVATGEVIDSRLVSSSDDRPVHRGEEFELSVAVDLSATGRALGSYGARLRWDPKAARVLGVSGGSTPGFMNPVVNRAEAARGELRFADADPRGATGTVELLRVRLMALRPLPHPARAFELSFDSAAATGPWFEVLRPLVDRRRPSKGEKR